VLPQECHCRQYLARCAKAALHGIVLDEGSLHRVQLAGARDPLYGDHLRTLTGSCQYETRINWLTVQQDRTSATFASPASELGTSEVKAATQRRSQRFQRERL
jgi:hypothetical protein